MTDAVLVTGASTGLGLATAVYLARKEYRVYATVRDLDTGRDLGQEATTGVERAAAEAGVSLRLLRLDLTDEESIAAAVSTILQESGSIYGLVNNAGTGLRGYFEDLEPDEIRQIFEVNLLGTMAVTRAVLPSMRQAGRGRIAIITSVAGRLASMGLSAYCATKFAQEGFGEALAQEVRPFGIYVSLIAPAIIKTERWSVNRGIARNALNPDSPYYGWFQKSEAAADRLVATSPTRPEHVARGVHRFLTARRPRMHTVIGRRANIAIFLRRYLPADWFERLYFGYAIRQVTRG